MLSRVEHALRDSKTCLAQWMKEPMDKDKSAAAARRETLRAWRTASTTTDLHWQQAASVSELTIAANGKKH